MMQARGQDQRRPHCAITCSLPTGATSGVAGRKREAVKDGTASRSRMSASHVMIACEALTDRRSGVVARLGRAVISEMLCNHSVNTELRNGVAWHGDVIARCEGI